MIGGARLTQSYADEIGADGVYLGDDERLKELELLF